MAERSVDPFVPRHPDSGSHGEKAGGGGDCGDAQIVGLARHRFEHLVVEDDGDESGVGGGECPVVVPATLTESASIASDGERWNEHDIHVGETLRSRFPRGFVDAVGMPAPGGGVIEFMPGQPPIRLDARHDDGDPAGSQALDDGRGRRFTRHRDGAGDHRGRSKLGGIEQHLGQGGARRCTVRGIACSSHCPHVRAQPGLLPRNRARGLVRLSHPSIVAASSRPCAR